MEKTFRLTLSKATMMTSKHTLPTTVYTEKLPIGEAREVTQAAIVYMA